MRWSKRVVTIIVFLFVANIILLYLYNRYSLPQYSDRIGEGTTMFKWYNYSQEDDDVVDGLNGEDIEMDDVRLVQKLRSKFLKAPPPYSPTHQYNLDEDIEDQSMGQGQMVRKYLDNKRNGVYVECGALDGETRSNTLYFERHLNWTGLLIEADPANFYQMTKKNRIAWLSPTCLSVKPYPEIVSFEQNNNMGKISNLPVGSSMTKHVDVQCFPFYTYLLALNMTHIDYFSLDVEGAELDVLKTIPFDKVDIDVLSVEFIHVEAGKDTLKNFMETKGYKVHGTVTHPNWLANDFIFVKS